ncbi:MAG: ABC transporter permease [Chloracidobacterium sp.]|nr:ABC transporter permease [Chloracidobacterium sp.]
MSALWQDLKFTYRTLRRNPGFTAVAVLTIALGMGVSNALFSLVNAFALRPIPVENPEQIVSIRGIDKRGVRHFSLSYKDYVDLQTSAQSLSGIVAVGAAFAPVGFRPPGPIAIDGDSLAPGYQYASGILVSDNYFAVLGARASMGRLFTRGGEGVSDSSTELVISQRFWRRQFNSGPEAIGKTIRLNGQLFSVIGIMAPEFVGVSPQVPDFWAPLRAGVKLGGLSKAWEADRTDEIFLLTARLKPGVEISQAEAELTLRTAQLANAVADNIDNRIQRIEVRPASTFIALEGLALPSLISFLAVGLLILLIACANLTNLLLARAAGRQREVCIRLALGASRERLIRQLLTESTVLALIGGVVALLSAVLSLQILYPLVLTQLPLPAYLTDGYYFNVHPDYKVFIFTLGLSLFTGVVFGLGPALQASRLDINESIKGEGSTLSSTFSRSRLRDGLVVAQVSAAFVLLFAAVSLVSSLEHLGNIDTGINTQNVYSVSLGYPGATDAADRTTMRRRELAERLKALPGAASVCEVYKQPRTPGYHTVPVSVDGDNGARSGTAQRVSYNIVSPEYFQTIRLPIVRGRAFNVHEVESDAPVVVVSESTAKRLWPGKDAVGQKLSIGDESHPVESGSKTNPYLRNAAVIGIARDANSSTLWMRDPTYIYIPASRQYRSDLYLLIRFENASAVIPNLIAKESENLDSGLKAVTRMLDESLAYQRLPFQAMAAAATAFGLLALLLASVGLYGVIAFLMSQRTREIAIRLAIGATPSQVRRLLLGSGARLVVIGLLIGIVGSLALGRMLAHALGAVKAFDIRVFAIVAGLLLLVSLIACYVPARRATRIVDLIRSLNAVE